MTGKAIEPTTSIGAGKAHTKVKTCGAKTRAGGRCSQPALENGRCHYHGGRTPVGPALPQYKHGRYSKYLPARLRDAYNAAEEDPELLSTRAEVAVMQARIAELLGRVYTGESGNLWVELRKANDDLNAARSRNDGPAMASALNDISRLIAGGASNEETWRELAAAMKAKSRLSALEWKRLVDLNQLITAERAIVWATALLDSVLHHVRDQGTRAAISTDFIGLMNMRGPGPMHPATADDVIDATPAGG